MKRVEIPSGDPATLTLWRSLSEIADELPGEWVLVGGLMVQLHAYEHGITDVRATVDVDVLAQARPQGTLERLREALDALGFEQEAPDLDGYAYRFVRGDQIIDVLAPEGIVPPPTLGTGQRAIAIPGGSQALSRSENVVVAVDGAEFPLRRPSLLGAVLIKARSLMVHDDPASQREDLLRLLGLMEDPRTAAESLLPTERRWLLAAEARLDLDGPSSLSAAEMTNARLAFRLLTRPHE